MIYCKYSGLWSYNNARFVLYSVCKQNIKQKVYKQSILISICSVGLLEFNFLSYTVQFEQAKSTVYDPYGEV